MGKVTEACLHFVPGPLKRRPKLAVFIACAGAIGAIGSGLAGFTDILTYFDHQPIGEDKAYITHQQFNTLIIPLVNNVEQMQVQISVLNKKVDQLQDRISDSDTSNGNTPLSDTTPTNPRAPASRAPASVPSIVGEGSNASGPPSEDDPSVKPELRDALDRVKRLQQEQRAIK